ncbi:MAG: hypothetical protein P8X82_11055 [Gemmatimonadales bacterium]|jgi:hypothetical protein
MTVHKIRSVVVTVFSFLALATMTLDAQAQGNQATLKVDNRNILDVVVYAVTDSGDRYRLGSVHRLSTADLPIPAELADGATTFRLKVYSYEKVSYMNVATAHAAVKTQPIVTAPGATLQFLVEARITESHIISL